MWVFSDSTNNGFNTQLLKEGESYFSPSSHQAAKERGLRNEQIN
jgi:hypothetical protein